MYSKAKQQKLKDEAYVAMEILTEAFVEEEARITATKENETVLCVEQELSDLVNLLCYTTEVVGAYMSVKRQLGG